MSEDGKYRHEIKYVISNAQLETVKQRLKLLATPDPHAGEDGRYNIRSLYFDDYYDRCLRENEDGTDPREKFRIRIYDHSAAGIKLECKRRERGKILKTSCPLTEEQCRCLMEGRYLPELGSQAPVLRKLGLEMMLRGMKPVVIVEYERTAYVYKNGNVRITLDTDISSSDRLGSFLDDVIPKRPVMPLGMQLMEVKFDEYLPDHIYSALQTDSLTQTAYSKYGICRTYNRRGCIK